MKRSERPLRSRSTSAVLAAGLVLLSACSNDDDEFLFAAQDVQFATNGTTPYVISGRYLVFLASENATGGGTMLNGDGDTTDQVAIVYDTLAGTFTNVGVAVRSFFVLGDEVYLVVSEAQDNVDWVGGMNGLVDVALVHWSPITNTLTAVDTLVVDTDNLGADRGAPDAVASGQRLYYRTADAGMAVGDTSLFYVDTDLPLMPVRVLEFDMQPMNPNPIPVGEDDGLLFCLLDEQGDGVDYNGDGDVDAPGGAGIDERIVALLDTSDPAAMLRSTGLAINPQVAVDDFPFRARTLGGADWIVAFLANEFVTNDLAQAGGFNDRALHNATFEPQCVATPDTDTFDDVLHWLVWSTWTGMTPQAPVNTGLSGIGEVSNGGKVVATTGTPLFVGAIQSEGEQGCDLNGDGDGAMDSIFRWVNADAVPGNVTHFTGPLDLVAVDTTTPGGANGVAELLDVFAVVIDEAADERDYNGDNNMDGMMMPLTFDVLAYIDPASAMPAGDTTTQWVTDQDTSADADYVICDWLAETPARTTMLGTFGERGSSLINPATGDEDLNEDGDLLDFIPVRFTLGSALDFVGPRVATSPGNAGIVQVNGFLFYRASEVADGRFLNGDLDMTDFVLMWSSLTNGSGSFVASCTNTVGPVIQTGLTFFSQTAAVFEANETLDGIDHNNDGTSTTSVPRYFLL